MKNIIEIKDVSFKYDEDKDYVFKNLSLNIKEGEFIAILGHNGCGKSTLAKLINALLLPESGSVLINNMYTSDESKLWNIRQTAGMVFQNPDNQLVATIVEDDIAFGPENLGMPSEDIRIAVDNALEIVGMSEYRSRPPHLLSGGQKQRIAIAGVLAIDSKCIILDEPTAMLDPSGRKEVMDTIKFLNKNQNKTIILITHYMDEAVQADRVVVMDKGNIVENNSPKNVFKNIDKLKSIGLDVPQVTELAKELIANDVHINNDIIDVEEMVDKLCQLKQRI